MAAGMRGPPVSVTTEMSGDIPTTSVNVLMGGTRGNALVQTELTFQFKIRVRLNYKDHRLKGLFLPRSG